MGPSYRKEPVILLLNSCKVLGLLHIKIGCTVSVSDFSQNTPYNNTAALNPLVKVEKQAKIPNTVCFERECYPISPPLRQNCIL